MLPHDLATMTVGLSDSAVRRWAVDIFCAVLLLLALERSWGHLRGRAVRLATLGLCASLAIYVSSVALNLRVQPIRGDLVYSAMVLSTTAVTAARLDWLFLTADRRPSFISAEEDAAVVRRRNVAGLSMVAVY